MASFVPVPQVARISFKTTSPNYSGGWRQFFRYTAGPPTQADVNSWASSAAAAWNAALAPVTASPLSLVEVVVADLHSDLGNVGIWQGSHPGGLATTFIVPADTCVLINHVVQRHYRGGKYRTYLPCGSGQELASARAWDSTYVTQVHNAWGTFIASLLGTGPAIGTLSHVGVSYKKGYMENPKAGVWDPVNIPAPRPEGPYVDGILDHRVSPVPATQKRRLRPS